MKSFLVIVLSCVMTALDAAGASRIDEPLSIKSISDYYTLRQRIEGKLSQDDYARFLQAIDSLFIYTKELLVEPERVGEREAVFLMLVNGSTPRQVIVLGSTMALQQCNLAQIENESLLKDADQSRVWLYKHRAEEAKAMKNFYREIISKYAGKGPGS